METNDDLSFEYVRWLKTSHPALKLLNADSAPLIISFLYQVFIRPNKRTIASGDLIHQLEDYLYMINESYGQALYPRTAKHYLNEWTHEDLGFLRKFYPQTDDEAAFDLTPAAEKAIEWLLTLQDKSFVGTESRLLTIVQVLTDIVQQSETDPDKRIAELQRQKEAIDEEILKIQEGSVPTYNATQIKERFIQAEDMGKKLLGDFRQVQHNFRLLDQQTREKIVSSPKEKGKLLSEIFVDHDVIKQSDQGKSFNAFWEFLMTPQRQQELASLVNQAYTLDEVQQMNPDSFLHNIHYLLLEAGEGVYITQVELAEQLRKYLDDQTFLENKRLMTLIQMIEKRSIELRNNNISMSGTVARLPELKANINLITSRDLFSVPKNPVITDEVNLASDPDINMEALFNQFFVDETQLKQNIQKCLTSNIQIQLGEIVKTYPVRKGIAELAAYLKIASDDDRAVFLDDQTERIWIDTPDNVAKEVTIPKIIFTNTNQFRMMNNE